MTDQLVARRYAKALYEVCLEKNIVNPVEKELKYFSDIFNSNQDLTRIILSPRISANEKKMVLYKIFSQSLSMDSMNFVYLLIDKKREELFPYIPDTFSEIIKESSNIEVARVTTAFNLSLGQQEELQLALSKIRGKSILLEIEYDPSIIGGLIVRVEDTVYDGSLTSHLKRIEQDMAG